MTRPLDMCILCGAALFEGIIHTCPNAGTPSVLGWEQITTFNMELGNIDLSKEFTRVLNEQLKEKFPFNMKSIVLAEEEMGDGWKAIEILQTPSKPSYIDKSNWGEGPWHNEPDEVSWITECGYQAYIIRQTTMGHLCGYVFLEKGHPCHEVRYNDVSVEVHGGLTYSGKSEDWNYTNITPSPDGLWILGFDCGHMFDYKPGLGDYNTLSEESVYRQVWYCRTEVERLANQLKDME